MTAHFLAHPTTIFNQYVSLVRHDTDMKHRISSLPPMRPTRLFNLAEEYFLSIISVDNDLIPSDMQLVGGSATETQSIYLMMPQPPVGDSSGDA